MSKNESPGAQVVIYPDWCKGCGICVAFCPAKALAMGPDGKAVPATDRQCLGCGFCESHCPDFAILLKLPKNGQKTTSHPAGGSKDLAGPAPEDLSQRRN